MEEYKSECELLEELDLEFKKKSRRWIGDFQVSTAYLCSNKICRGHTILTYNRDHFTELFQLEKEERIAYLDDLVKVSKAVYDAFKPHKMNYELLGNDVPHLHWHIIPRQKTDPIELHWLIWGKDYTEVKLSDDKYQKIVEKIRIHLQ